jgi:hypothetical protein
MPSSVIEVWPTHRMWNQNHITAPGNIPWMGKDGHCIWHIMLFFQFLNIQKMPQRQRNNLDSFKNNSEKCPNLYGDNHNIC